MNLARKLSQIEVTQDEIEGYCLTAREQAELERQFDQVGCDWHGFRDEFIRQLIRRKRKA